MPAIEDKTNNMKALLKVAIVKIIDTKEVTIIPYIKVGLTNRLYSILLTEEYIYL